MVSAVSCGIESTHCRNDPLCNLVLVSHPLITLTVRCTGTLPYYLRESDSAYQGHIMVLADNFLGFLWMRIA